MSVPWLESVYHEQIRKHRVRVQGQRSDHISLGDQAKVSPGKASLPATKAT